MQISTHFKKITLAVENLVDLVEFYTKVLKFDLINFSESEANIGIGDKTFLNLKKSDAKKRSRNQTGMYHMAFLFEKRLDLANTLKSVIKNSPETFEGSADHLVSEAFYLHDIENNGIELYFDRPRNIWQYDEKGEIKMATLPLDPIEYINEFSGDTSEKKQIQIGHIHLQSKELNYYKEFLSQLNYQKQMEFESAIFYSQNNYHHHFGVNNWYIDEKVNYQEYYGLREIEIFGESEREFSDDLGLKYRIVKK